MRKLIKALLIVVIILAVLCVGGFVALFAVSDWDFNNLKYENREYVLNEDFSKISIEVKGTDVKIVSSTNDECKIVCFENNNYKHSVGVENDTLVIKSIHQKVFFGYKDTLVTVYLPEKEYASVDLITTSGDVDIKNLKAKTINCFVDTGDVDVENGVFDTFTSTGDTGDIELENVVTTNNLTIKRNTGEIEASLLSCGADVIIEVDTGDISLDLINCKNLSIKSDTGEVEVDNSKVDNKFTAVTDTGDLNFTKMDVNEVEITTDTGEVKGSFTSDKIFAIRTSAGKVDVPQTTSGGVCKITTHTGDIIIKIG